MKIEFSFLFFLVTVASVLSICLAQKRTMTKQKTFGGMRLSLFFSPFFCVRVCVCVQKDLLVLFAAAPRSLILLAEGNAEETERISVS